MKKILCTFLLSAMLVLVLGGCEVEVERSIELESRLDGDAGVKGEQEIRIEQLQMQIDAVGDMETLFGNVLEREIHKLQRRVESLEYEARFLHECAMREQTDCKLYYRVEGGLYDYEKESPYRSGDAFKEWKLFDYYPDIRWWED